MSINATETTPLMQLAGANPYEVETGQYLSYRHLRQITLEEAKMFYPGIRRSDKTCMMDSFTIGGLSCLLVGGLLAGIAFWESVFCCLSTAKISAIAGASFCVDGAAVLGMAKGMEKLSSERSQQELNALVTHLCNDGSGNNEEARVTNDHVLRIFPLLNTEHFNHMDLDQVAACYKSNATRERLVSNLENCKTEIRAIWTRVIEHHRKSPEEFANLWKNHHYRTHTLDNIELQQAIIEFLPDEMRSHPVVMDAINKAPITTHEPSSSIPQPIIAATSSSPSVSPKQWVLFVVNKESFEFERDYLEGASVFFKNLLETNAVQSELDPSKMVISLDIPEQDHEPLSQLLKVIRGRYPQIEHQTFKVLYMIAKKYQLDTLLQVQLNDIFINTHQNLCSLLEISCNIEWKDLESDVALSIIEQISMIPIEDFSQAIQRLNLVEISTIANQYNLVRLKKILEIKYISCVKLIKEKFRTNQFGNDFETEIIQLAQYALNIEPTLQFLHETEIAQLHSELNTAINLFLASVTVQRFKCLSVVVTSAKEHSILKRCLIECLRDDKRKTMISRAFPTEMPNRLYRALYGYKQRMQASSSNS